MDPFSPEALPPYAPVSVGAEAIRDLQNAEVMLRSAYMRVHDARVIASVSTLPVVVDLADVAGEVSAAATLIHGLSERSKVETIAETKGPPVSLIPA